jgi:hypothetical protein
MAHTIALKTRYLRDGTTQGHGHSKNMVNS